MNPDEKTLLDLAKAVVKGKAPEAGKLTRVLLDIGVSAQTIIEKGLMVGMGIVSSKFKNGDYYVPEVLISSRAFKTAFEILRGPISITGIAPLDKRIAIGTVRGDLHDIGKNIVVMVLEGAGFEVNDLGIDVRPATFVEAVKDGADIIALSSLLTTSMPAMKETIEALETTGVRNRTKVLIGGAPITQNFADDIGADGFAWDAYTAVIVAKKLLNIPFE